MKWKHDAAPPLRRRKKLFLVIILGVAMIVSGGITYYFRDSNVEVPQANATEGSEALTKQPQESIPVDITGRYLMNGTVVWARAVERYAAGDYSQPFSQLDTFKPSRYDAQFVDLECPITNNVVPYQQQIDKLIFNCRPEFLGPASKYFQFYNLANNHSADQGASGLDETRRHLNKQGVQYFGTYNPSDTEHTCEVIALPVNLNKDDGSREKASLPVAVCSWHFFSFTPTEKTLSVMDEYARIMPVFAFVEMGAEYLPQAQPNQVKIARGLIDRGAEFVIANSPHWIQNAEAYKGKLIVYSMGNFIFDQIDKETQRSASIDVKIQAGYDQNLADWLELSSQCKKYQDKCLKAAKQLGLKKLKFTYTYDAVAGLNGAGKVAHKADASAQKEVEERLDWANVLESLGQQ